MDLNNVTWGEFKVEDLFDIHPTSSYKLTNKEIYDVQGDTPVLSNSSINNGIGGYCGLAPTEDEGIITFSDTTTGTDTMFYQPNKFIGYPHVQGMYPKGTHKWSDKECLYLISIIKRSAGKGWNYSNKFNRKIVLGLHVKLPITSGGTIDWHFMEDYITELEQERITELEKERITELEQYLIATGLNDYHLTTDEKTLLDQDEDVEFKEYKIGELFKGQTGDVDLQQKDINGKGTYFINSGEENLGIKGKTDKPARIFSSNTITIDFWGNVYYRNFEYKMATHNHVFSLSGECIKNKEVGLYLVTRMSYLKKIYSYSEMGTWNKIKEETIQLPITKKGELDYLYMENYIKAIEKLVIKDVVKYKDEVINTTKTVAESK